MAAIQLLEGAEYRFICSTTVPGDSLTLEPVEVFQPDGRDGRAGRLRPGLFTGTLPVKLVIDGQLVGQQTLEVRSRKLDYLSQYRWMLRDIASRSTEIVMDSFAAASTSFSSDEGRDAMTLYEQFAFLRSLVMNEELDVALGEIVRRPHVVWIERHELAASAQGIRADSHTVRQLTRRGDRVPWENGPITNVPRRIDRRHTEATHDTTPNRFIKFVLERWRQVIGGIGDLLGEEPSSPAVERGRREVREVLDYLEVALAHDVFREVGPLRRFPSDDQVLQKREGYRDVLRTYLEFELAARLAWPGGERVYAAGQKDVATLYEYWAFLQLAGVVSDVVGKNFDLSPLLELRRDGLSLTLREGQQQVLSGTVLRNGRKLAVRLWFNRGFSSGGADPQSWTALMRPDYSLGVEPAPDEPAKFEAVILHFDAKYRLDFYRQLFEGSAAEDQDKGKAVNSVEGTALRTDLLKMHAYRDAIRRSAGAYVLYPGTDSEKTFVEYHELLPGLGAFPLRPTESGATEGAETLRRFIDEALDHVALQITQHERGRYWIREAYAKYDDIVARPPAAGFLSAPPADTQVLLGYVKNKAQWEWIRTHRLYNLRGKGRRGSVEGKSSLLGCRLVLLSCPSLRVTALASVIGDFEATTEQEMRTLSYPEPTGSYLCAAIEFIDDLRWRRALSADRVEALRLLKTSVIGEPIAVTWLEVSALANTF